MINPRVCSKELKLLLLLKLRTKTPHKCENFKIKFQHFQANAAWEITQNIQSLN